jgi:hypothetical protein
MMIKVRTIAQALILATVELLALPGVSAGPTVVAEAEQPDGLRFDLTWDAPAGCPDGDAVKTDVLRLAGSWASNPHRLKAKGGIRRHAESGFSLLLATELDGESGERTLTNTSCQSLGDAAALMLALILNPDLSRTSPAVPSQPPPSREAKGDKHPSHLSWLLGAQGGLQAGVLQDLSSVFALSLGVASGRLSLRLLPSVTLPQEISAEGSPGIGGRVWAGGAALLGCWATAVGRGVLAPCLGFEVAMQKGNGRGVLQPRAETNYWSSAELAGMAGYRVSDSVTLQLSAVGLLPLHRPSLYLNDIGVVTRPAVVGFKASAGIEFAFK